MQLFGTSGIRRVADQELLQLTLKVGMAVGKVYDNGVVGCDTRTTSQALKHAVISGLLCGGSSAFGLLHGQAQRLPYRFSSKPG
jgi:phosphoglucosamine mutase